MIESKQVVRFVHLPRPLSGKLLYYVGNTFDHRTSTIHVVFMQLHYCLWQFFNFSVLRSCHSHLLFFPPVKATQLDERAYAYLREFIHGVEDTARVEMV